MELKLGKITNKYLAEWFGVKPNTFNKYKDKKLEELKDFADFHLENGKVFIDNIKIPCYEKMGSKSKQMIRNKIDEVWSADGLDTCSRVSLRIEEELKNELTVKSGTVYQYTIQSRNELYGRPFMDAGSMGNCKYLWCKKEGDGISANLTLLTPEEEELKQSLIKKYFGDATEKQIIVKGMVAAGEISKEEAWEVLEELTNMKDGNFVMFLNELQEKVGCQVIRGTFVERNLIEGEGTFC